MLYDNAIGNQFELEFEPSHAAASDARRAARTHLDRRTVAPDLAADVELVISELTANAVDQQPEVPIRLTVLVTDEGLAVTVTNRSSGGRLPDRSTWSPDPTPEPLAERGWGLGIVESLSDEVWIDEVDGWTSVGCLRRVEHRPD